MKRKFSAVKTDKVRYPQIGTMIMSSTKYSNYKPWTFEPVPKLRFTCLQHGFSACPGLRPLDPWGYIPTPTSLLIPVPNTFFIYTLSYLHIFLFSHIFQSTWVNSLILCTLFILANISTTFFISIPSTHIWLFCL